MQAGDTAESIAEAQFGDPALADAIALANPGLKKYEKGQRIRLPKDMLAAYKSLQTAEGAQTGVGELDQRFERIIGGCERVAVAFGDGGAQLRRESGRSPPNGR